MMREAFFLAGVILVSGTGLFGAERPDEGRLLFNGRDLAGWTIMGNTQFEATNQNLRLVSGTGWLRSTGQHTNFVLELEWRALEPGYDSGIFVRAGTNGTPWPEQGWQINLARTALGGLVKGNRTVVPAETAPVPLNTWVKFRIAVQNQKISLDVDGKRAWEYDKLDAPYGYIGIQAEGKAFEFRNIRILSK